MLVSPGVTAPSAFLLQPNLIWLAGLSSNNWLYDFNDTRFQFFLIFFLIFLYYWLLWNSLSHHQNIIHIIKK